MIDYQPIVKKKGELKVVHKEDTPQNFFRVRTANQCLEDARSMPIPKRLITDLWCEGELCILFADTNVGKSIFAVQAADTISSGHSNYGFELEAKAQKVLYFDFEMSDKQFQKRCSHDYQNNYVFDDNFLRVEIIPDAVDFKNFEQDLFDNIEANIIEYEAKILIVDNLTYLRSQATDTAKEALPLMKVLNKLKKKFGLSILALAHTPKRDSSRVITINDLAGSKQIANFADSIFAIGASSQGKDIRYIKQLKARNTSIFYGTDNVIICRIQQPDNFLFFNWEGNDFETNHLKKPDNNDLTNRIVELKKSNPSITDAEIARRLETNPMRVRRELNKVGIESNTNSTNSINSR